MQQDLALVRELQSVDNRIRALEDEISRLPKYIAEIESKLESHKKKLEADRNSLAENKKSQRLLEGEISSFEQKISRLREQMNEARTNEQFRAFQHEIQFAEEGIRKIEDRTLDKMEEAETLAQNVASAEAALKIEAKTVEQEVAEKRARVAQDETDLAAERATRQQICQSLSPDVLTLYERIRKARGGGAVAEATADRCTACNVVFRPQFSQMLRRNDRILTCEQCGLILYYEPPGIGIEDPAHESNVAPG